MNSSTDQKRTGKETAQRRDDALRRALNTPPKPHDDMKLGKARKPKPSVSASSEKA